MKNEFEYNIRAFSSVILKNNEEKLKEVNELIIEITYRNNEKKNITINKNEISDVLIKLLNSDDINLIKELNINYIQNGLVINLNGITCF
jgi:hypothetical protein